MEGKRGGGICTYCGTVERESIVYGIRYGNTLTCDKHRRRNDGTRVIAPSRHTDESTKHFLCNQCVSPLFGFQLVVLTLVRYILKF
jgi:hypothetical protein